MAIREFDHSGCSNGGSGKANIAYLISHPRPMAEGLRPRRKDIAEEFRRGFVGMTLEPVSLDELIAARDALTTIIVDDMPTAHREFLIGFKSGEPDWSLVGLPGIADLPAVRWKQRNLDQLEPGRRDRLVEGLRAVWPS